ncbi:amino acid ABC transporter permease [Actinocorallia sp. A-T 12471]|uniref:amino acid ABC transporter permease n=1 Tax=Actinocorallia sp. A-T 12471 TaxID=3089813 RepID=UPI0029CCEC96|nr:amino acid ABC transporter permease [Actinocorallia sp. A-T 12471]MDX6743458.1 amino acid ABC transporter permease [Actinocorallia sp. A-T 12471]
METLFDNPLFDNHDAVLTAFWATIRLTVTSALLSFVFGTLLAALRVSPVPVLRGVGTVYVNIARNTPLTLVLLFCSLGISSTLRLNFDVEDPSFNGYWFAVLGLTAYTSAFVCETLRAGINTVPMGQAEAARAIGLSFAQSMRLVILPQAFRAVIAPLGSVLIALTKNTTVAAVAGYAEAAFIMKEMLYESTGGAIEIFLGFAAGFVVLTLPIGFLTGRLARRLEIKR